jgi:hypothetical protein
MGGNKLSGFNPTLYVHIDAPPLPSHCHTFLELPTPLHNQSNGLELHLHPELPHYLEFLLLDRKCPTPLA